MDKKFVLPVRRPSSGIRRRRVKACGILQSLGHRPVEIRIVCLVSKYKGCRIIVTVYTIQTF